MNRIICVCAAMIATVSGAIVSDIIVDSSQPTPNLTRIEAWQGSPVSIRANVRQSGAPYTNAATVRIVYGTNLTSLTAGTATGMLSNGQATVTTDTMSATGRLWYAVSLVESGRTNALGAGILNVTPTTFYGALQPLPGITINWDLLTVTGTSQPVRVVSVGGTSYYPASGTLTLPSFVSGAYVATVNGATGDVIVATAAQGLKADAARTNAMDLAAQAAGATNAAHVAETDPHGDRAYTDMLMATGTAAWATYADTAGSAAQSTGAVAQASAQMSTQVWTAAQYPLALTNVPTLQQTVDAGSGPVTNAPYLVQTNATDVTFAGWRMVNPRPGNLGSALMPSPSSYAGSGWILDGSSNAVMFFGGPFGARGLSSKTGEYVADFSNTFSVGPTYGTDLPVYATLTSLAATQATVVATQQAIGGTQAVITATIAAQPWRTDTVSNVTGTLPAGVLGTNIVRTVGGIITTGAVTAAGVDLGAAISGLQNATNSVTFSASGPLATSTGQVRWYPPRAITLLDATPSVGTAPVGAAVLCGVCTNGVAVATATIADGTNLGSSQSLSNLVLSATDYATINITQVGTTNSGAYLTVRVRYK